MRAALPVLLLLGAAACTEADERVGLGTQLLLPDDLDLHWDASYNGEEDGLGALIPVDVMVYEGMSGAPMAGVAVAIEARDGVALVLSEDAVIPLEPETCEDCDLRWDAERDQYVLFDDRGASEDEEPWSDGLLLSTDDDGLARVHLYVDAFEPEGDADFAPLSILVSTGAADSSFDLIPR